MKTYLNLLPPMVRRQQLLRKRVRQWSLILCALAVLGVIAHWHAVREQRALAQQFEVLAREHQPTRTMLDELIDMRRQLAELEQQQTIAAELEYQRQVLTLLGVVSQTTRKLNGRLRVTQLELTEFQSAGPISTTGSGKSVPGSCVVAGVALDNPSVADLFDSLQDSGLFRHVEVLAVKQREGGETVLHDYELRCLF